MKQFVGLDVSLKSTSIRVVDGDGSVTARGEVPTDPDTIRNFFTARKIEPERIVHESGQLSIWLTRQLDRLGP